MGRRVGSGWEGLGAVLRTLEGRRVRFCVDAVEGFTEVPMPVGRSVEGFGLFRQERLAHGVTYTVGDKTDVARFFIPRERFVSFLTVFGTDEPGGQPFPNWYEIHLTPGLVISLEPEPPDYIR